jgi:hypothetical protein
LSGAWVLARQGTPYFNSAPVAAVFPVPVFSSRVFVVVVVNVVSFEKPAAPERIRHTPLVAAKYNRQNMFYRPLIFTLV